MSSNQPLGYLVKSMDNALNAYVDGVLRANHNVTRGHWQALRTAQDDPNLTREKFMIEAAAFYTDAEIEDLLDSLSRNDWIRFESIGQDHVAMRITEAGRTLLSDMSKTQGHTYAVATEGISSEEYSKVVNILAIMVDNLEAAIPS